MICSGNSGKALGWTTGTLIWMPGTCQANVPSMAWWSLRNQIFFLSRTALKDCPKGPPTANRRQPPTSNRHQPPPTGSSDQPPSATNHQSLTTYRRQPPPTATNRQLPTANRQSPPTANRQPPPTMVEHMECPRAFWGTLCNGTLFFSPLRTALLNGQIPDSNDHRRLMAKQQQMRLLGYQDICTPPPLLPLSCDTGVIW